MCGKNMKGALLRPPQFHFPPQEEPLALFPCALLQSPFRHVHTHVCSHAYTYMSTHICELCFNFYIDGVLFCYWPFSAQL